MEYRMLKEGEIIRKTDEYYESFCEHKWKPVEDSFIGYAYYKDSSKPVRRKVKKTVTKIRNLEQYEKRWGNYKSDKYKSKRLIKVQITDLLTHANFSKKELVKIKNFIQKQAYFYE